MPPPLPICPRALLSSTSTRALLRQPSSKPQSHTALSPPSATRPFSSSTALKSGDGHESHYDPPSGWLWGIPPGEKPKKEGWETIWYWGFWGSLLVLGVGGWVYREDSSIQTWALEEARRRLEAEGILADPSPSRTSSIAESTSSIVESTSNMVESAVDTVKSAVTSSDE
ncbi:MAG: hypothetical protein MMC33_007344 [Icmadophila ericetorum]|nr:hypothetical protein [Icmadophila ericetorum]